MQEAAKFKKLAGKWAFCNGEGSSWIWSPVLLLRSAIISEHLEPNMIDTKSSNRPKDFIYLFLFLLYFLCLSIIPRNELSVFWGFSASPPFPEILAFIIELR
jgi:hypothetical protein